MKIDPTTVDITSFRDNALDMLDALTKDLFSGARYLTGLSGAICECLGLSMQEQITYSRSYDSEQKVFELHHWSEPENESGYAKQSTHGNLVAIEKVTLLKMLEQRDCFVVFEISIPFEDKHYNFYGTPSKPANQRSLYVLRADGTKELIAL